MLYMIHHHSAGESPALVGEGAPDMIGCRFDASLDEMIAIAKNMPRGRLAEYGLTTDTLTISERGRKAVFTLSTGGKYDG